MNGTNGVSVSKVAQIMDLYNFLPDMDLKKHRIKISDVNRPALQLSGFFEHFEQSRVQIIGNVEYTYLQRLDVEKKEKILQKFTTYDIPCIIFCRDLQPDEDFLQIASENDVPVLGTKRSTSEFMAELIFCLSEQLAPCISIHGVLVDVYGEGLLIMGESGIGKSEAALELVRRGHRLVTDDVVEIRKINEHTLIGGFAGAAIMAHGFDAIQLNIILKIAVFIFLAPFIGMVVAFGFTLLVLHICRRAHPNTAEMWFKKLQLVSSALFSIGHGLNDSQKVMGIIAAALIAAHSEGLGMGINSINDLPDWVAFSCFTAISLGTMSGGWKIVKTMGTKITKVTPLEGVVAETAGAFTLYLTEYLKIPVSTTHTITGAIIGVGATKRLSAVRWGITRSLMTAWVLTIPVSGILAAVIYGVVTLF